MATMITLCVSLILIGVCKSYAAESTISELQGSIAKLMERNEELTATVNTLQDRVTEMEKERGQRQVLVNPQPEIAFMATALNREEHLHLNQHIIYDSVITNIGNAYNPQTGEFQCPVTGTYLFNFNIMADSSNYIEGALYVNGNPIVHALSDQHDDGTSWDMGTTNAILRLIEGDVVSVSILFPKGENTVHGNKYNTFSGYLLRAAV